jgi:hypothetical protein
VDELFLFCCKRAGLACFPRCMTRALAQAQADALAAHLDLDLDDGIRHACLSFVAFALDTAEPREIARELRRVTIDLWEDGLDVHALAAVERACELGLANAREALDDLGRGGGKSIVARAIVRRLAGELSARTRTTVDLETRARERLPLGVPEMN